MVWSDPSNRISMGQRLEGIPAMDKRRGFTLIELLVVIAIIAILMAILMPALQRVKQQARTSKCLAHLKQWGLMFAMYCDDNEGYFFTGELNGSRAGMGSGEFWRETMRPYTKDFSTKLWCCPQATKPLSQGGIPQGGLSFMAWETANDVGSYGLNGWMLNIVASVDPSNRTNGWGRPNFQGGRGPLHWYTPQVKNANEVPVFTGSWWVDSWPLEIDNPPQSESGPPDIVGSNEMIRVCVDRHNGFVNSLFCDWTVRKVGLKELWTLKWHRFWQKNADGSPQYSPWTKAGGVQPDQWPQWMRHYKEY
jgi:prepilin-type N-terminal cleavage/methylation domain-containing protein